MLIIGHSGTANEDKETPPYTYRNGQNPEHWRHEMLWRRGATGTGWEKCRRAQPLWKTAWRFLTKLNTYLASEPAIKILGIYPNELKPYIHTKTYILMFMVALFLTAETWKSPRYPSESEWFIQPTECHAVIKRNELASHKETWRKHNCIWLSVRIQSERPLTVWVQQRDILEKKNYGDSKDRWLPGAQGGRTNKWSTKDF